MLDPAPPEPRSWWHRLLTIEAREGDAPFDAQAVAWAMLPLAVWTLLLLGLHWSGARAAPPFWAGTLAVVFLATLGGMASLHAVESRLTKAYVERGAVAGILLGGYLLQWLPMAEKPSLGQTLWVVSVASLMVLPLEAWYARLFPRRPSLAGASAPFPHGRSFLACEAEDGHLSIDPWPLLCAALPAALWALGLAHLQRGGALEVVSSIALQLVLAVSAAALLGAKFLGRRSGGLSLLIERYAWRLVLAGAVLGLAVRRSIESAATPSSARLLVGVALLAVSLLPLRAWLEQRTLARGLGLRASVLVLAVPYAPALLPWLWVFELDTWMERVVGAGQWLTLACALATLIGFFVLMAWRGIARLKPEEESIAKALERETKLESESLRRRADLGQVVPGDGGRFLSLSNASTLARLGLAPERAHGLTHATLLWIALLLLTLQLAKSVP